jgi:hypothetical protein
MVVLSIIEGEYTLGDCIGEETILQEHKEFYLNKPLPLTEIENLFDGNLSRYVEKRIYETTIYYINKYFDRYLISLANISKIYLRDVEDFTHSKFCIGVSDDGDITGIPLKEHQIPSLKEELVKKVVSHYDNIMGLHNKKGGIKIQIEGTIYYNYEKLVNILKKHTRINIHKVKNTRSCNGDCLDLEYKIKDLREEETDYLIKLEEYKRLMDIKIQYNNKYSVPFNQLIRADEIMDEFKTHTSLTIKQLDDVLSELKSKIIERRDVEGYLLNGLYIKNTLYPDDTDKDKYYGELVKTFLEEYKYFKIIQLRKNINIPRFIMKNPMKQLTPLLNNVNIFNEQLDMDFYMIEIEIPFIKDINAHIASKKDKKILERGYTDNMDMPCTL